MSRGGHQEERLSTLSFHHGCKRLRPSSKHTRRKSQFAFCGHNYVPEQYGGAAAFFRVSLCVFLLTGESSSSSLLSAAPQNEEMVLASAFSIRDVPVFTERSQTKGHRNMAAAVKRTDAQPSSLTSELITVLVSQTQILQSLNPTSAGCS